MMWSKCNTFFFFFKQKTAYEMRISDWSSDVCSSDLPAARRRKPPQQSRANARTRRRSAQRRCRDPRRRYGSPQPSSRLVPLVPVAGDIDAPRRPHAVVRHHVVEEAGEGSAAPRPSDKAAVQADRQHLRLPGPALAVAQEIGRAHVRTQVTHATLA